MSDPAPRKPRPPARETETARGACDIRRMGADVTSGKAVQGYCVWRVCARMLAWVGRAIWEDFEEDDLRTEVD